MPLNGGRELVQLLSSRHAVAKAKVRIIYIMLSFILRGLLDHLVNHYGDGPAGLLHSAPAGFTMEIASLGDRIPRIGDTCHQCG